MAAEAEQDLELMRAGAACDSLSAGTLGAAKREGSNDSMCVFSNGHDVFDPFTCARNNSQYWFIERTASLPPTTDASRLTESTTNINTRLHTVPHVIYPMLTWLDKRAIVYCVAHLAKPAAPTRAARL